MSDEATTSEEGPPPGRARSWDGAVLAVAVVAIIVAGLFVASRFVSPAPPRTIHMAAGRTGGGYALFAERYREALERRGIALEIEYTSGTMENFSLLRARKVDVALAQTGVATETDRESLKSLGSLFHEPLWLFVRNDVESPRLTALNGLRIDPGPPESGTRALASKLLLLNGVDEATSNWVLTDDAGRTQALARGEVDAIFRVGSVDSPSIQELLANPQLRLQGFDRALAYARVVRSLSRIVLPEGVIDFQQNIPPSDTVLVSAMGELVVADQLHPALVDLLLQATTEVHAAGDIFSEPGELPSQRFVDLPLSPDAERYYKYGPPLLQRYLPFWAATQIDRLKVMLIPLVALLLPLIRIFPPTYRWRVRSRIYRWYRELRDADPIPGVPLDRAELGRRLTAIANIEHEVAQLPTPPSYAEELYSLRLHVEFVQRRLEAARDES